MICNSLYWPQALGGAEISVRKLAEGFAARGHAVTVINIGEEPAEYEKNGVDIVTLGHNNRFWVNDCRRHNVAEKVLWRLGDMYNRAQEKALRAIIGSRKPDVIHTNCISGFSVSVWNAAHREDVPLVHTLREYYLMCRRSTMYSKNRGRHERQDLLCRLYTMNRKRHSHKVHHVAGVSDFILRRHIQAGYFKNSAQSVVFNPLPVFKSADVPARGAMRFAFVGRLVHSKGIETLIDAFNGREETLYVFGRGEESYVELLKKRAVSDNIRFMGYTDKNVIYSEYCDVLAMPVLWDEPYGGIFLDARSAGKYVIATENGGNTEVLCGYDKCEYTDGTARDMVRILDGIAASPGKVFAESDLRTAGLRDENSVLDAYEEIYETVANKR